MGSVEVIVVKIVGKKGSTVETGVIGSGISPFAGDGLDEALGLAVGLGSIRSGEEMFEAELPAGGRKEFGAISGTAIGEDALDRDAMSFIEADGLLESVQHAGSFFIGKQTSEGEAGMIVNGHMEGLDAGARVALSPIAGGTHPGVREAAQLLDVEVKELAGMVAFVADDGRFWRLQRREAIEMMAAQHAGESGFGDGQNHPDLGIGTTFAAQLHDPGFELRTGPARLVMRHAGAIGQAGRKPAFLGAGQPSSDSLLAHTKGRRGGAPRQVLRSKNKSHFGSHQRSECGISVHVVRGVWRWVWYSSTTSLHDRRSADNLLKHDT